jgi:hypothetical protein
MDVLAKTPRPLRPALLISYIELLSCASIGRCRVRSFLYGGGGREAGMGPLPMGNGAETLFFWRGFYISHLRLSVSRNRVC